MKIRLTIRRKMGGTPLIGEYNFNCDVVPRVGEMIHLGKEYIDLYDEPISCMVVDVEWVNNNGNLEPELNCIICSADYDEALIEERREELLTEKGWLPPKED